MAVCVNCGKESGWCLCEECRGTVDMDDLCRRIVAYHPGTGENPLWDRIASELSSMYNFRQVVFSLAEELPSPRREYWKILSLAGMNANVQKDGRPWLYENYERIKGGEGLSRTEMARISGLVLGALFMEYRYEEADRMAGELLEEEDLPVQVYYNLADFYSKTRRYDEADEAIQSAERRYGKAQTEGMFRKISEKNREYREKEATGRQQFMPNPKENKEAARNAYIEFLSSIGIRADIPVTASKNKKYPEPVPKDQYPDPMEIRGADFDSFVAYDLETTGVNTKTDAIIEIGAIKVSGGVIVESKEYVFREFVHPFKRNITERVTELTGITVEDVREAREMWEVFPDFMDFVGDGVMVGFNNVRFDSRFLKRAGRYSHLVMENPQFDVMKYAEGFRERLGITDSGISLETLSRALGIENPDAHRALADAITTARVYLRLKEMDTAEKTAAVDDILADLDSW